MTDIATHIRIFDAQPTDDLVEKRISTIDDLSERFAKRKTFATILQLASDLSAAVSRKGVMSTELINEVEIAIKEYSPSFVQTGNELQMLVCALLATLKYLETATPSKRRMNPADILAAGLWSALSFQPCRTEAKLEALRKELLSRSQLMITTTSFSARHRSEVPDFTFNVPEEVDWQTYANAQTKGYSKTIKALRENSALDREELDLLWWVLSDWSSILNETLSVSPVEVAAIVRGIEVACMLRRLPGDAHKHLVLKGIVEGDSLTLKNLVKTLADTRMKLVSSFQDNPLVEACPAVFPLLSVLVSGKTTGVPSANAARTLHEWAARALLERSILHVASLPNPAVI